MAVTVTFAADSNGVQRVGNQKVVSGVITPTGTYETGGVAVTAALFGLGNIESLSCSTARNGTEFMVADWIPGTSKIMLGWGGGAVSSELDEITNADTVTGFLMDVTVKGRG